MSELAREGRRVLIYLQPRKHEKPQGKNTDTDTPAYLHPTHFFPRWAAASDQRTESSKIATYLRRNMEASIRAPSARLGRTCNMQDRRYTIHQRLAFYMPCGGDEKKGATCSVAPSSSLSRRRPVIYNRTVRDGTARTCVRGGGPPAGAGLWWGWERQNCVKKKF